MRSSSNAKISNLLVRKPKIPVVGSAVSENHVSGGPLVGRSKIAKKGEWDVFNEHSLRPKIYLSNTGTFQYLDIEEP